jgi:hypothetical protein
VAISGCSTTLSTRSGPSCTREADVHALRARPKRDQSAGWTEQLPALPHVREFHSGRRGAGAKVKCWVVRLDYI